MSTAKQTNMVSKRYILGWLLAVAVLVGVCLKLDINSNQTARAESASSLAAQIGALQEEINANQAVVEDLEHQADSLRAKIAEFNAQIAQTQNQIDLTNLKIKKLNLDIKAAEKELEYQKGILAESIRELYKRGDVTTVELLASSDSYTDFINEQEYLSRLKVSIQDSAAKIEELKKQLEASLDEQQELAEELEGQRRILDNQRADQQRLLDQTEGQEAKYQAILDELKDQQAAAEAALQQFIVAGQFVNLGPVSQGDPIGNVGNTGFSTGPHLHFEVRKPNGSVTDPKPFINNGWTWPTVNSSWQIWQDYGVSSGWYVSGYHPGIDTGYSGETVRAMAGGTVIARGCSSDYLGTPAYGYMVMISHSNGHKSLYAHMLPPSGGAYSHCSGSYGF